MHRKPEAKLLPLDTKLERTLRNLKKVRCTEAVVMQSKERYNRTFQSWQLIDLKDREL